MNLIKYNQSDPPIAALLQAERSRAKDRENWKQFLERRRIE